MSNQVFFTDDCDGFITVDTCKGFPNYSFVFGDNTKEYGNAGQAQIRGMENAYGIPTKVSPGMSEEDFFSDDKYDENCAIIDEFISRIPIDRSLILNINIGRGLAKLHDTAPKTYGYMLYSILKLAADIHRGHRL